MNSPFFGQFYVRFGERVRLVRQIVKWVDTLEQEDYNDVVYQHGIELAVAEFVPQLPDDFDSDVVENEFLLWKRDFGTKYDADDLEVWRANFGVSASAAATAAAVPEPASAALLGAAMLLGLVL